MRIHQVEDNFGRKRLIKMWEPEGHPFEPEAIQQIENMAKMPFIFKHVAVMADAHAGKGSTVGTVFATKGAIIPAAVGVDIGCVDRDTEYLTPTGWRRIADYREGDKVLVFNPYDGFSRFEEPQAYIKRPSSGFYHFKTKYGINQMLSPDHRMLLYKSGRKRTFSTHEVLSAEEVVRQHHGNVQGYGGRINTTPDHIFLNTAMDYSDEALRVIVMCAADGHFDRSGSVVLHFRKRRKFDRALELLEQAGIEASHVKETEEEFTIRFRPISDEKPLTQLWASSIHQLRVIAGEVLYWDGNHDERCFYTRSKDEADFVQYAFLAAGKRAVLRSDVHSRDEALDYRVYAHENTKVGIKSVPRTEVEFVLSEDGYEYCFTVSTGFFLIRRGGVTALTGNCGMMAVRTSLTANDLPDSLSHIRGMIEAAVPHGRGTMEQIRGNRDPGSWGNPSKDAEQRFKALSDRYDAIIAKHPKIAQKRSPAHHMGTLGTGNHFIELCLDEDDRVWVMLHSGSRGIGNSIGTYFINKAKEEMLRYHVADYLPDEDLSYLVEHTTVYDDYIEAVDWAQDFAMQNRKAMMEAVLGVMRQTLPPFLSDQMAVECHHNYVTREQHYGEAVLVTRKGAVQAREGTMGIIPGSMGTGSFIVRGLGNHHSFNSCSHGAGRVMSRTKAKKLITLEQHAEAMKGIEARLDADIIDESPAAYKDVNKVMEAQTDLVEIKHRLRQILNVKG